MRSLTDFLHTDWRSHWPLPVLPAHNKGGSLKELEALIAPERGVVTDSITTGGAIPIHGHLQEWTPYHWNIPEKSSFKTEKKIPDGIFNIKL